MVWLETPQSRAIVEKFTSFSQAEIEGTDPAFIDVCFRGRPDSLRVGAASREDLVRRMLRGGAQAPETTGVLHPAG